MTGPTRTEPSNHRVNPLLPANPPRPPNAWILYRSDKLKDLPPPPPGMPRQPQADISKTISAMWKSESPEVRAHYERLSDIRKAEHQALYPGYRFQPMKKADKDRLRAEKQAEKERERGTRRTKARSRVPAGQEPPPLYTTEARFPTAGPSQTASSASTPSASHSSSQQLSAPASQPSISSDLPTPPGDHPPTPAHHSTSPSPYPLPPSTTSIPPLIAPRPGVPQRPPSASGWHQDQQQNTQGSDQEFNALWLDQGPVPDMTQYSSSQEYLTVPLPNHAPQHPLGWSPDDPVPLTDLPFYQGDPLHAVLSATDDPNVFNLGNLDFDVNELFDGTREIEVSMGTNMMSSSFGDMSQFNAFANLLSNWDTSQFPSLDPNMMASTSVGLQANASDLTFDHTQRTPSLSSTLESLGSYSFESMVDEQHRGVFEEPEFANVSTPDPQLRPTPTPTPTPQESAQVSPAPYVPPAGAANSSTRRVAADWKHIRLTPEPEVTWTGHRRS